MSKYFAERKEDASRLRALCRKLTEKSVRALEEALDAERVIVSVKGEVVAQEPDHKIRVLAATALLDRGYGKPAQEITVTPNVESLYERISRVAVEAGEEDVTSPTGETH